MAVELVVDGIPFDYPEDKDGAGWGQEASDWAIAITDKIERIDPTETGRTPESAPVSNDQSTFTNVSGVSFNITDVNAIFVQYIVIRSSTSTPSSVEAGQMTVTNYLGTYSISIGAITGDSGINFNVSSTGHLQYTSTDIGSDSYSGSIKLIFDTL